MRVVFFTAFQPFVSRNMLNTGVLEELLSRNVRVVLFVPPKKVPYFTENFGGERVEVIGVDIETHLSRKEKIFRDVAQLLVNTNIKKFHKMQDMHRTGRKVRYYAFSCITFIFARFNFFKRLFRVLEYCCNQHYFFDEYISRYKPAVVFSPDVYGVGDTMLLKAAKRLKIPTVGMVLSWDNNTSKGLMRFEPDHLIVQNNIIKDEAITLQAIPPMSISVSGIPHYEYYIAKKLVSREAYFKELGIDQNKKLILVCPAGEVFIDTDWQMFEILKRAAHAGKFRFPVHFLISMHPTNKISLKDFVPDDFFTLRELGIGFKDVRSKDNELTKKDIGSIIDMISNSDVVINVVSSMIIDAAVLGKPIVTAGFNGWEENKVHFVRSVRRFLKEENMDKLLATGGTKVAHNEDELIQFINAYLENPMLDSDTRKKLVERQCGTLDGFASKRIVDAIVQKIHV